MVPQGEGWLHELKLDGYRIVAIVRDGKAALFTRRGHDWTERFPSIATALEAAGLDDLVVDGEVVVLRRDGTSDFQALQNVMRQGDHASLVFFVFDLMYYHGYDLRSVALIERKKLLARVLDAGRHTPMIRFNDHILGEGKQVLSIACRSGLEGIVAKRADSRYVERRTTDWVKIKCLKRQEFVIGGWTDPGGGRESLGALLLGYYNASSQLVYCGRVGTGFTEQSLRDLQQRLAPLATGKTPFKTRPTGVAARGVIHWVEPRVVAEVAFAAWTDDGLLRHASFQGIREDKAPTDITREVPIDMVASSSKNKAGAGPRGQAQPKSKSAPAAEKTGAPARRGVHPQAADEFAGVRLTHPDRVIFPEDGITKRDLAVYYMAVAPFILPHVEGRPLSLVRCPDGEGKACFYQKHLGSTMPPSVHGITVDEKDGTATYMTIDSPAGLISLVQMGVLEIHPWGSRGDRLDRPDRMIFDIRSCARFAVERCRARRDRDQAASRRAAAPELRPHDRRQRLARGRTARPPGILGRARRHCPGRLWTPSFAKIPSGTSPRRAKPSALASFTSIISATKRDRRPSPRIPPRPPRRNRGDTPGMGRAGRCLVASRPVHDAHGSRAARSPEARPMAGLL